MNKTVCWDRFWRCLRRCFFSLTCFNGHPGSFSEAPSDSAVFISWCFPVGVTGSSIWQICQAGPGRRRPMVSGVENPIAEKGSQKLINDHLIDCWSTISCYFKRGFELRATASVTGDDSLIRWACQRNNDDKTLMTETPGESENEDWAKNGLE